ncbi:MAG: 30S ribosomal protein S1 [Nitrospirota bacterium]|nr:30S ribosomal protein S1 [Nitrospirota bacterium]
MAMESRQRVDAQDPSALETSGNEDFASLFEQSLGTNEIRVGSVVTGKVVDITENDVIVDVGYKSEGRLPISQFLDEAGQGSLKPGDRVDVYIEYFDNETGQVAISRDKAQLVKVWDDIVRAAEEGSPIKGRVIQKVKGGLSVDIQGLKAFLPGSQVDIRPTSDFDIYVGNTYDIKVLKVTPQTANIVVSRKALLEEERLRMRKDTIDRLVPGVMLEGIVKNVTDYGVFVDLGGIDGLVHITDVSWGRVSNLRSLYNVGEKIEVRVLNFDKETERVSLGIKQLSSDPWESILEKYPVGGRVRGKIVSITDYGAFMKLEEGIEGLIHISEMSWTKKIKHPSKVASVGDEVDAVVLSIDPERQRISLGLKQTMPNPWDTLEDRYPEGSRAKGTVNNVTDYGIFVELEEGIKGLVHISDLTWSSKPRPPHELYQRGDEVEAVVLKIDKGNERLSLGVKQLSSDPWEGVEVGYQTGQRVTGKVSSITDFGLFVELEPNVEGLLHISQIPEDLAQDLRKAFQLGQELEVSVLNVSKAERRIALSLKE